MPGEDGAEQCPAVVPSWPRLNEGAILHVLALEDAKQKKALAPATWLLKPIQPCQQRPQTGKGKHEPTLEALDVFHAFEFAKQQ